MSALRRACLGHSPPRRLTYRKLDFILFFWVRVLLGTSLGNLARYLYRPFSKLCGCADCRKHPSK